MKIEDVEKGEFVYYAGAFYQVAEIKDFPHGKMVGIYDEPPSQHIDYIAPESLHQAYPCYACQGSGCSVCSISGFIIEN